MDNPFAFTTIGIVHSCFPEKFAIPRQPRLADAARASLEILPPFDQDEAFSGLSDFSHLWLVFVFHGNPAGKWRPTVRPPRLGGNRRTGVFATRSGFRPNPIGISAVALDAVHRKSGKLFLEVSGIDILDQTPVLDIKPYLPYADMIPEAVGGFADRRPRVTQLPVVFTAAAQQACARLETAHPGFVDLLEQVLRADPRPAYADRQATRTEFGLRLYEANVRWSIAEHALVVHTVETGKVPER